MRETRLSTAAVDAGFLQAAIFNRPDFSCIATDAMGIIQVFNGGSEHMLGYGAAEVLNRITPADLADPQDLMARAAALSLEFRMPALSAVPVVIISIVAERNKGFALGAAAVMQKPISREELYGALVNLGLFPVSDGALKVLVVDDDPKAVELIAVRIQGLASTVLRAYSGREAIDTARQELPDLIVLDLMMPVVSGFDVVEELKHHPDTARIPIVVVTAKQISAADLLKLNAHVSTIMEKTGFDPDGFTTEVRRAMSGRHKVA